MSLGSQSIDEHPTRFVGEHIQRLDHEGSSPANGRGSNRELSCRASDTSIPDKAQRIQNESPPRGNRVAGHVYDRIPQLEVEYFERGGRTPLRPRTSSVARCR